LCAAELRLRTGTDRPARARRVACADDSLTMITCGRGLERAEDLRLTDGCRSLIGPRNVCVPRSPGGVRVWHGAARYCQNCGHAVAARRPARRKAGAHLTPRSAQPLPGSPQLPHPALPPLALPAPLPHPNQPGRTTPPLLQPRLPHHRIPQAAHVIKTPRGGDFYLATSGDRNLAVDNPFPRPRSAPRTGSALCWCRDVVCVTVVFSWPPGLRLALVPRHPLCPGQAPRRDGAVR
jgi:hypothetical protein